MSSPGQTGPRTSMAESSASSMASIALQSTLSSSVKSEYLQSYYFTNHHLSRRTNSNAKDPFPEPRERTSCNQYCSKHLKAYHVVEASRWLDMTTAKPPSGWNTGVQVLFIQNIQTYADVFTEASGPCKDNDSGGDLPKFPDPPGRQDDISDQWYDFLRASKQLESAPVPDLKKDPVPSGSLKFQYLVVTMQCVVGELQLLV